MENFERQMADHADKENRAQHGKLEKTGGVNADAYLAYINQVSKTAGDAAVSSWLAGH